MRSIARRRLELPVHPGSQDDRHHPTRFTNAPRATTPATCPRKIGCARVTRSPAAGSRTARLRGVDPRRPVPARGVRQQAMPDEVVTGGAVPFHARIGVELDDAPLVRLFARQAFGVQQQVMDADVLRNFDLAPAGELLRPPQEQRVGREHGDDPRLMLRRQVLPGKPGAIASRSSTSSSSDRNGPNQVPGSPLFMRAGAPSHFRSRARATSSGSSTPRLIRYPSRLKNRISSGVRASI